MYHIFKVPDYMIKWPFETLIVLLNTGRKRMTANITMGRLIRDVYALHFTAYGAKSLPGFTLAKSLLVKSVYMCCYVCMVYCTVLYKATGTLTIAALKVMDLL